jgi:hypothetical protein
LGKTIYFIPVEDDAVYRIDGIGITARNKNGQVTNGIFVHDELTSVYTSDKKVNLGSG